MNSVNPILIKTLKNGYQYMQGISQIQLADYYCTFYSH